MKKQHINFSYYILHKFFSLEFIRNQSLTYSRKPINSNFLEIIEEKKTYLYIHINYVFIVINKPPTGSFYNRQPRPGRKSHRPVPKGGGGVGKKKKKKKFF